MVIEPISCPCGLAFQPRRRDGRYCSPTCKDRYKRRTAGTYYGTCEWCGSAWAATGGSATRQRYCSNRCRGMDGRVKSQPVPWGQCDQCASWFVARGGRKRCSPECRRAAQLADQAKWIDKRDNSERGDV